MYTASCLCGKVQFKIEQAIDWIYVCHCKQCQKAQGTVFAAIAIIETPNLYLTQGSESMGEYFATENKKRVFCTCCASPLYSARLDLPDVVRLRVGIINEDLKAKVYSHAFTEFKACWFDLPHDNSSKFEGKVQF